MYKLMRKWYVECRLKKYFTLDLPETFTNKTSDDKVPELKTNYDKKLYFVCPVLKYSL